MLIKCPFVALAGFLTFVQATAPDFKACEHIKVEQLNAHHDSCGSDEFTAECLAKFNAKGLDEECLGRFKFPDKMQSNTVKQLSEGGANNLPLKIPFMRAFLNKHSDWDSAAVKQISEHVAGNEGFMVSALGDATFPKDLIAKVITADSGEALKPSVCAKFSADLARALSETSLSKINKGCLEAIPVDFFDGITPELLGNVNPEAFRGITAQQAKKLRAQDVGKLKPKQAENWGVDPVLPSLTPDAPQKVAQEEAKAREAYIEAHPCHYIRAWSGNVPPDTAKAFAAHCKPVLGGVAAVLEASAMTLMLAVMVALTFMV